MINEIVVSRSREAFLVELQLENQVQARRIAALDSAVAAREKENAELKAASADHKLAYASLTKSLEEQAKEIRRQKRLKFIFGAAALAVLVIDHAR